MRSLNDIQNQPENKDYNFGTAIAGGFGSIYILEHRTHKKKKVIKTVNNPYVNYDKNNAEDRKKFEDAQRDLRKEMSILEKLSKGNNPYIVKINRGDTLDEPFYFDMEYVDGKSFYDTTKTNILSIDKVFHFIDNISQALSFCHNFKDEESGIDGILHNDLHGENILWDESQKKYVLIDFGLYLQKGQFVTSSKTRTGWCEFMSPERCDMDLRPNSEYKNVPASPAWDIYSLGCLIYMAITGIPPYILDRDGEFRSKYKATTDEDIAVLDRHFKTTDKLVEEAHVDAIKDDAFFDDINRLRTLNSKWKEELGTCPDWLIRMVKKCMAQKAEDRYKTGKEFFEEFDLLRKGFIPSSMYDIVKNENERLREEKSLIQEAFDTTDAEKGRLSAILISNLKRNWMVAIIMILALGSNCMSAVGGSNVEDTKLITIILSIVASIVMLGIATYDSFSIRSNNKNTDK